VSLGCYGDVLRVKILYNKKDSTLIQFAESFQAHSGTYVYTLSWYDNCVSFNVKIHLNGIPLYGTCQYPSIPREGSSEVCSVYLFVCYMCGYQVHTRMHTYRAIVHDISFLPCVLLCTFYVILFHVLSPGWSNKRLQGFFTASLSCMYVP